ncbi:hypothetical protein ASG40_08585 [Methylobacterium sp. Leaf399]|uniref:GAF domain-containing protein n=1 Tax=unclassified Methylobacterium TaxID=2615210 RepID=UPI0006FFE102|nr:MULTISPECIES: GAF domain-containing protein [unclassified Methylobacterium]KQP55059.1 hypothetical protein ASF39_04825 [Methylobacterium sp. Leaf108]KQT09796.1 hypothetical protein ASG40_08585 [Methylobacterium sp. Leaf399]KQT77968.1 hypothetical protein ASG59_11720 [Methylobacterium sp. Leaf466]
MASFIRVTEVWVPSKDGTALEFGSGSYGGLDGFHAQSHQTVFGYGEGLPGQAWATRRPIVLKDLQNSYFKRGAAAAAAGLTCGLALPIFAGDVLQAVVTFFCADDDEKVGAIEVWSNDPARSSAMAVEDGYYGNAEFFERNSKAIQFGRGQGLPGEVWERDRPVVVKEPYGSHRFLRKAEALKIGRTTAFGLPCHGDRDRDWVMTFLSALGTPIARRFEVWKVEPDSEHLTYEAGLCEVQGDVAASYGPLSLTREDGTIGRILLTGLPVIATDFSHEPTVIAASLAAAGLTTLVAIPVFSGTARLNAVAAWYF